MCNGHNHPIGCMCGWGGDGHLGRRSGTSNIWSWLRASSTGYPSYVNPNARCPVCGEDVYFYQSPDGGRVFFDDLGPPWPKHPCTDSSRVLVCDDFTLDAHLMAIGQLFGWTPFVASDIQPLPTGQLRIHGQFFKPNGRPGVRMYLETLNASGERGADLLFFHIHGSGLPYFVREHAARDYFELAEIDLIAKHDASDQVRSRSTEPVMCIPQPNCLQAIRRASRPW